jgi:hypothetical protein
MINSLSPNLLNIAYTPLAKPKTDVGRDRGRARESQTATAGNEKLLTRAGLQTQAQGQQAQALFNPALLEQGNVIKGWMSSLSSQGGGAGQSSSPNFFSSSSALGSAGTGGFNLSDASQALTNTSFNFADGLSSRVGENISLAQGAYGDIGSASNLFGDGATAMNGAAGKFGDSVEALGKGATTAAMAAATPEPWSKAALFALSLAQFAQGAFKANEGGGNSNDGTNKSDQAYMTAEQAQNALNQVGANYGKTSADFEALKTFNLGFNPVLGTLADADKNNQSLLALGSELGAKVQAPPTPAGSTGAVNSSVPSTGVVDTSWSTPPVATTPQPAANGSTESVPSSPLALGANTNTVANSPTDVLNAEERKFMGLFEANGGIVNDALTARNSALGVAPQGMDTSNLAGTTNIVAASTDSALQDLYARLKEKEAQKPDAGVLQASTNPMAQAGGVGANGQAGAGNAPNGAQTAQNPQGYVANAPVATTQGQPGQPGQPAPTSVATASAVVDAWTNAPTAPGLTIPQVAKTPATLTAGLSQPAFV